MKKYFKWFCLSIIDLISVGCALIISPITSFFVNKNGDMIIFKSWLQTPDSNMFGVSGDVEFSEKYKSKTKKYLGRVYVCFMWQWRNTAQGFSQNILGIQSNKMTLIENTEIKGNKYLIEKTFVLIDNEEYFQFKGEYYLNELKRIRWNFGWKLNMRNRQPKCMIVISFNPYMNR